jgi:hypothetical protein
MPFFLSRRRCDATGKRHTRLSSIFHIAGLNDILARHTADEVS